MHKISLIIPCYNEEKRLQSDAILRFLAAHPQVSVLFVNDGSRDETQQLLEQLQALNPAQVSCLLLPENRGKAECVRQGILNRLDSVETPWLGFWDADLSTPLDELDRLLEFASGDIRLILSCRVKRLGAVVRRHALRHIVGRVGATLISLTTGLPLYDSQCGAKLIHRQAATAAFSKPFLSRWLFDVEILLRLRHIYPQIGAGQCAIEVPVTQWTDVPGSKLKLHHLFGSLVDLARIAAHYRLFKSRPAAKKS